MTGVMGGTEGSPQPHRPMVTDDLNLGIDAALPVPKRLRPVEGRTVTSPPQPHRPLIVDDLDLGVTGNQVPVASVKRKAANDRQREAAAENEEHERWYRAMVEQNWGPQ